MSRPGIHRVILVEGVSDRAALLALAERRGRRLETEGISVLAMGGVTNIGRFLRVLGPEGLDLTLGGLCDAGDEGVFRRYLEGEAAIFRTFQNQPFQRGRAIEQQLHRFIGTLGGRKERYARAFIEHLELDAIPRPIEQVLAVASSS